MCLATIYTQAPSTTGQSKALLSDVAYIKCEKGKMIVTPFLGESKTVYGYISTIDFARGEVIINTENKGDFV